MKTIQANPKSVEEIFRGEFIVPEFQRPYSWDKEDCTQLWEDIKSFFDDAPTDSESYYLGSVVLYPTPEGGKQWHIIDGQQRLTTLSLLIRCLLDKVGSDSEMESVLTKAIYKSDPDTDMPTAEMRLRSMVETGIHGQDLKSFEAAMSGNSAALDKKNPFRVNYELLFKHLSDWWDKVSADERKKFIRTLRNQVSLLPIECADEDDALTLFERINNRGNPLADADIFKAKLYRAVPEDERRSFIDRWNAIGSHEANFRVYMYISRAKRGKDTEKEIALRPYMMKHHVGDNHQRELAGNWSSLMGELEAIDAAWENYVCSDEKWQSEEDIYWEILKTVPNVYWQYPAFVFQNKHGELRDGKVSLADDRQGEYIALLKNAVRYFFIKGVVYNSVNRVKDGVFKVCKTIAEGGDYTAAFKDNVSAKELEDFYYYVAESDYGRYQRGLVYVNSLQNEGQNWKSYAHLLSDTTPAGNRRCQIEHILPQEWANYDKWDAKSHSESIDEIGNLIPLERRLNIRASNEFFQRKQKEYAKSKVQDALDLAAKKPVWYPGDVEKRQEESLARLRKFFDAIKK